MKWGERRVMGEGGQWAHPNLLHILYLSLNMHESYRAPVYMQCLILSRGLLTTCRVCYAPATSVRMRS